MTLYDCPIQTEVTHFLKPGTLLFLDDGETGMLVGQRYTESAQQPISEKFALLKTTDTNTAQLWKMKGDSGIGVKKCTVGLQAGLYHFFNTNNCINVEGGKKKEKKEKVDNDTWISTVVMTSLAHGRSPG